MMQKLFENEKDVIQRIHMAQCLARNGELSEDQRTKLEEQGKKRVTEILQEVVVITQFMFGETDPLFMRKILEGSPIEWPQKLEKLLEAIAALKQENEELKRGKAFLEQENEELKRGKAFLEQENKELKRDPDRLAQHTT